MPDHFASFLASIVSIFKLLRFVYRCTAAITVEGGRRGIDGIIPVHVGDDEFVGLCGQDKNRIRDILENLVNPSNE
jgi:hypothetical protein